MSLYDLDEDYEAKYKGGFRIDPENQTGVPVGLCRYMCSYEEMQEREKHKRLNKYEIMPGSAPPQVDFGLAIKEFKRSCVGREFTHAMDLRPWSILRKTLYHLLLDICLRKDDWMFVCDFVFDRLKAVRQDMVIQRIEGSRYIEVLEGSIRFLIYSMYKLTCTLEDFSKMQPPRTVITMDGLVSGLNNYEMNVVREMKLTMKCLRECLYSLIKQYEDRVPDSPNRAYFEAINMIVNLPFVHGATTFIQDKNFTEFQADQELRNSDKMYKIVWKIYRLHLSGNHLTALKLIPKLYEYPLIILAYAPAIARLQVRLMVMLKKAYTSRGSNTSSLEHLCALLCPNWLEDNEDVIYRFGKFMAVQFSVYDAKRNLCDYNGANTSNDTMTLPKESEQRTAEDRQLRIAKDFQGDNDTRNTSLDMIVGREWSFYKDVIKIHGVERILDPSS